MSMFIWFLRIMAAAVEVVDEEPTARAGVAEAIRIKGAAA